MTGDVATAARRQGLRPVSSPLLLRPLSLGYVPFHWDTSPFIGLRPLSSGYVPFHRATSPVIGLRPLSSGYVPFSSFSCPSRRKILAYSRRNPAVLPDFPVPVRRCGKPLTEGCCSGRRFRAGRRRLPIDVRFLQFCVSNRKIVSVVPQRFRKA